MINDANWIRPDNPISLQLVRDKRFIHDNVSRSATSADQIRHNCVRSGQRLWGSAPLPKDKLFWFGRKCDGEFEHQRDEVVIVALTTCIRIEEWKVHQQTPHTPRGWMTQEEEFDEAQLTWCGDKSVVYWPTLLGVSSVYPIKTLSHFQRERLANGTE